MTQRLDAHKDEFIVDWEARMPIKEMAAKYNVHHSTISSYSRHLCLKARKKPTAKSSVMILEGGQWLYDKSGVARWVEGQRIA